MPERRARHHVPEHLLALQDQYVTIAGEIASVAVEREEEERKVDHVWIEVRAGEFGRLQIALSTCSRQSRAAGFDPRVRLGIIESRWTELPRAGLRNAIPLNYAHIEAAHAVRYDAVARADLEMLLVGKGRRVVVR